MNCLFFVVLWNVLYTNLQIIIASVELTFVEFKKRFLTTGYFTSEIDKPRKMGTHSIIDSA